MKLTPFRTQILETERQLAVTYLTQADGCITQAAMLSGLHRSQLRRIVVRHALQALLKPNRPQMATHGNAAWRALDAI